MIKNTANQKSNDAIKEKIIGNARNRTRQTHRQLTLIFSGESDYKIMRRDKKEELSEKGTYQIMRKFNSKVSDNNV